MDFKLNNQIQTGTGVMIFLEEGTFLFRPLLMFQTLLCFDLVRVYCFRPRVWVVPSAPADQPLASQVV